MGFLAKGFKVDKGEKILWIGKKNFKSLLLLFFLGACTIFFYGIGMILILLTIILWINYTFIITDKRVIKLIEYQPFAKNKFQYIELCDLHGMYSTQSTMGKIFGYWKLTFQNSTKITFNGIANLDELKKHIRISYKKS